MKRLLPALAAATCLCLTGTAANAAVVTWNGTGDIQSDNNDLGITTEANGQADVININDPFQTNSSAYRFDGQDVYNVFNGGSILHTRVDKLLRSDSDSVPAVINVSDGGTLSASNYRNISVVVNFTGSGNLVVNGSGRNVPGVTNLASDWTGSIFFGEYDAAGVRAYLDANAKIFFDGSLTAMTSADEGSVFVLSEVAADTGGAPALFLGASSEDGVNGSGTYLTLVPEPGSLALLGLGGLFVSGRRRR